ncbi:hypothetical protein QCB45_07980 [Thiomicrorhabdus sp. ZW0627]|uniref:hypothetical protein n=1 Tax=Thiomicrorhabdus sp. ZW0627 TaxID=3039774 RepID=UPI0024371FF2|nr:hypothetical protein [Thiomicrorhabdus sp. ZW0627]MDG6774269.1 hypothetical protein [Thiomicrorhabdus sp. ZW0627]
MRFLNWLFGLFGYEWVIDPRPVEDDVEQMYGNIHSEDWEEMYEDSPRYVLRKKSISRN